MEKKSLPADLLCLTLLYVWLAIHSYPYLFESLTDNLRVIQTYNLDTMANTRAAMVGLAAPWFRMTFSDYGHVYFNMAIAVGYFYSLFAPLTEHSLVLILRFVALAGGFCTIAIVFQFARRYLGRIEAVFAAGVMAFSPAFVEFSTEVHPDTWQTFFLTLAIYYLARSFEQAASAGNVRFSRLKPRLGLLLASSAAAGLAFGTKYLGILLIPMLAIASLTVPVDTIGDRAFARASRVFTVLALLLGVALIQLGRIAYPLNLLLFLDMPEIANIHSGGLYWAIQGFRVACLVAGALCIAGAISYVADWRYPGVHAILKKLLILGAVAAAFAIAFAVTSPWLLPHLHFVQAILARSAMTDGGAWFGLGWLSMLLGLPGYRVDFLAYAPDALALFGIGVVIAALCRRQLRAMLLPFLLVLVFLVIFLAFMIAKINYVSSTYLLPAVPLLTLLAALGLHEVHAFLLRRLDRQRAALAGAATAALFLATQMWQGGGELMRYPNLVKELSPTNRQLGEWLQRCAPADARILAAAYSYVPPHLSQVTVNTGPQYYYLDLAKPQLITINVDDAEKDFRDAKKQARTPGYVPSSMTRYYDAILRSGVWQAGPTFMPYRIYVKANEPIIDMACR